MSSEVVHFQWQNPNLKRDIYPFREEKLRDFLLIYDEIDLVKDAKKWTPDEITAKIQVASDEIKAERNSLVRELKEAQAEVEKTDVYWATVRDSLKGYYLNRKINELTMDLAPLEAKKARFIKNRDAHTERGNLADAAYFANLIPQLTPKIESLKLELRKYRTALDLMEKIKQLPEVSSDGTDQKTTAMKWEMRRKREAYQKLDQKVLIAEIIQRFDQDDKELSNTFRLRYEKWLRYMVLHFSGMRYRSSHASWADPKILLEMLIRDNYNIHLTHLYKNDKANFQVNLQQAIQELEAAQKKPKDDDHLKRIINTLVSLKSTFPLRTLIRYSGDRDVSKFQDIKDEEEILELLKAFRKIKEEEKDPIPDWAWAEIAKYTRLRLETNDPGWEALKPARWKFENRRWYKLLTAWEQKDITDWREQHRETLELIVTRAVCNEIAEHIQHLRGIKPAAGLTAKPPWYYKLHKQSDLSELDEAKPYFKRAFTADPFKNGASIFWLDWVYRRPNAWQVCSDFGLFDFLPARTTIDKQGNARFSPDEWTYQRDGNGFKRTKRKLTPAELKKIGKTQADIAAHKADVFKYGQNYVQYLRWTHEATVVEVAEMIDGWYVLTFETGQIGLILRRLSYLVNNRNVFVGYTSAIDYEKLPELRARLDEMLDPEKILQQ